MRLPIVERMIAGGRAQLRVALPVLFAAQRQQLMPAEKALDDALDAVQRGTQSSAASAVNKLAVRLAAGSDRLAQLVRRDQDLAAEAEALDKAIVAAVSKERAKRDVAAEQRSRDRLAAIAAERAGLQKTFAVEFPDYAALSNPLPLTAKEMQALLSDGGDGAVRGRGQGKLCVRDDARSLRLEADSIRRRGAVAEGRRVPPRPRYRQGERCLRQVRAVRSGACQRTLWDAAGAGRGAGQGQAVACWWCRRAR